jgi:hypothetical protein
LPGPSASTGVTLTSAASPGEPATAKHSRAFGLTDARQHVGRHCNPGMSAPTLYRRPPNMTDTDDLTAHDREQHAQSLAVRQALPAQRQSLAVVGSMILPISVTVVAGNPLRSACSVIRSTLLATYTHTVLSLAT